MKSEILLAYSAAERDIIDHAASWLWHNCEKEFKNDREAILAFIIDACDSMPVGYACKSLLRERGWRPPEELQIDWENEVNEDITHGLTSTRAKLQEILKRIRQ